jgi:hypothetical protein|tara:strand:- start:128 stop:715 length:588 start_codon:yes stop_codon:yes gene_type:complete
MIQSDIDIDSGDRDKILSLIRHIPASMRNVNPIKKHPTGVYITNIPYDPVNDLSSLDYKEADSRGYFKLDLLNVNIYNQVKDENHLIELMKEPDWSKLTDKIFVEKLIHLNNQYDVFGQLPEPVNSIPRLSMFLSIIRPGKRHLIGKTFSEISKTVWDNNNTGYTFKKSHAVAYAQLVVVHMNLIEEAEKANERT